MLLLLRQFWQLEDTHPSHFAFAGGYMEKVPQIRARLMVTYLKDKTELLLYVFPKNTRGSATVYRRTPGDAAIDLRIETLLENVQIKRSNIEIWVMLYPPEIITATLYTSSYASRHEIDQQIREELMPKLSYAHKYDWNNYIIQRRDNGYGQLMVTVSLLGKDVLNRIRSLLYRNYSKVTFVGDGLQFINVNLQQFPQVRGQIYEVILPYDELQYRAVFRSGIHMSSKALVQGACNEIGPYKLKPQQVYLDLRRSGIQYDLPQIQPIVAWDVWANAVLPPSAFPAWYITQNSLSTQEYVNFAKQLQADDIRTSQEGFHLSMHAPQMFN